MSQIPTTCWMVSGLRRVQVPGDLDPQGPSDKRCWTCPGPPAIGALLPTFWGEGAPKIDNPEGSWYPDILSSLLEDLEVVNK